MTDSLTLYSLRDKWVCLLNTVSRRYTVYMRS